ncbi:MAG: thrombospondin type 3 repeat-containing protein [Verrucomicrobiota bacterium]
MNRRKELFFATAVLLASSSLGFGQLVLTQSTKRMYRQQDANTVNFREVGTFRVALADGSIKFAPTGCTGPTWFPKSAFCSLGATGYIVKGDVAGAFDENGNAIPDGYRDDFSYYEIASLTAAATIEPSRPDLVYLYSAPPSGLPRPLNLFADDCWVAYYNIMSEVIKEYDITRYSYGRDYTQRDVMDKEIVPGLYQYSFPSLHRPIVPVIIPVVYHDIPEGSKLYGRVRQGFRYLTINGEGMRWAPDGFVELDPRVVNTFKWEGNTETVIVPRADTMYFSILRLTDAPQGDPTRPAVPATPFISTLFPGFAAPGASRILLTNALQNTFKMPPGMIRVTSPPTEGCMEVTLLRSLATSTICSDLSQRRYQCPVRFINTYAGWAAFIFPFGTPASARLPDADPDGDGFTNYQEWLAGTNPMLATSHPAPPSLAFVQGRASHSTSTAAAGFWETKVTKADVSPKITYSYEFSTDMQNWSPVVGDDSDPNWHLIETPADPATNTPGELKVQSKNPQLSGSGFLRVKMLQGTETPPVDAAL